MTKYQPDIIRAPWTPEQVAALEHHQASCMAHPYTCNNYGCRKDLIPTTNGWVCECGETQDWFYPFTIAPGLPWMRAEEEVANGHR